MHAFVNLKWEAGVVAKEEAKKCTWEREKKKKILSCKKISMEHFEEFFSAKKKRIGIAGDATKLFDGDLRKIL